MNRRDRRELERRGFPVLEGVGFCDICGAPYCPRCETESVQCDECSEWHCPRCNAYVIPAAPTGRLAP